MQSKSPLNPEEQAIWGILKNHREAKNAISAGKIAELMPPYLGRFCERTVRHIIQEMIVNERTPLPVAASGAGYYVSTDRGEIEDYAERLRKRGVEIFERRRAFLKSAERCGIVKVQPEQMRMAL
jgi:hypothetical protein